MRNLPFKDAESVENQTMSYKVIIKVKFQGRQGAGASRSMVDYVFLLVMTCANSCFGPNQSNF